MGEVRASNVATIFCISIVILCLSCSKVQCGKFAVCGKSRGIVTASRSAALATKIMQKCGMKFARSFRVPAPVLMKLAEKICIGIRLCYAYASTRAKNSTTVLKQHIRNCMVKGSNFFYAESADQFFVSAEQLKRITEYLNHCMDDDMMDIDSSVQLGVIRYLLKSANLASPSL
ncbi:uncharacterized protein LOC142768780 isoform X2 [Rhipicephalus microplus]|uniref:uncharacterized protein LOC142768780 isoform X2 n=1 Tax=Rhipicephalus microplus TaxID=6941 RepID=UPI003F6C6558